MRGPVVTLHLHEHAVDDGVEQVIVTRVERLNFSDR